jgi:hypothetical protein
MYQRFPGEGAQFNEPSPQLTAPQSVLRAVKVMYVGIAASLLGVVIDLTTLSATRSEILKRNPGFSASQVNNAEHIAIGTFIAGGLIGAALWLWMAQSCKAGKGWARVVSTVFFGINTLSVLIGATGVQSGGIARFYGFVVWVIGLVAIILLWQRSSSEYFRGAPRY